MERTVLRFVKQGAQATSHARGSEASVMSKISPQPIIARVAKTWTVPPGLKFAVVEDVERQVWIVESCPAGTQCWTLAQAAQLTTGSFSRHALQEAVRVGMTLEAELRKVAAPLHREPSLPAPTSEKTWQPIGASGFQPMRRATRKRVACGESAPARGGKSLARA